jgi:hypothetical protein
LASRNDLPEIIDVEWPNCCQAAQSYKKCRCGEFEISKVNKPNSHVISLQNTRQSAKNDKLLLFDQYNSIMIVKRRLDVLKMKKEGVAKKTVQKRKLTQAIRKPKKRKIDYEVRSDLTLYAEQFLKMSEGKNQYFCPVCNEEAQRLTNAMQHAVAQHRCTVIDKGGKKFVLNKFKCMHENCVSRAGFHSFSKFKLHQSNIHCRDVVEIEGGSCYSVVGFENCALKMLEYGCESEACTSVSPCVICRASYGCDDMNCPCWNPRPTCNPHSCKKCWRRDYNRKKARRSQCI